MGKLAMIMKELNATKNLLLEQYDVNNKMRETSERLRQLNAKLSRKSKDLGEYLVKVESENKKLKGELLKCTKKIQKPKVPA